MAITKATTLANTLPTILEEARYTHEHAHPMAALSWQIKKKMHDGSTINVPYFGTMNATALTEGVDMASPTTMADNLVTITPAEVGAQILITDKLERDNQEDITRVAGKILGDAMSRKRDTDLYDQLVDGTTNLGSGLTATMGQIAASHALLQGLAIGSGGPAPQPYVVVSHPYTLLDLVDVLTPVAPNISANISGVNIGPQAMAGSMSESVLRNYRIGRLFGMDIYEDGNATITGNNTAGGCFAAGRGGALILGTSHEWEIKEDPDPSLRATELNIVGEYGVGEYLAGWIVELYWDATTPA